MATAGTVWIVSIYDTAPGEAWRPLRSELQARALLARGFRVVLWTSTFSHHEKKDRAQAWEERQIEEGFVVRFIPATAYARNVGFDRLKSEASFADAFLNRAPNEPAPVAIVVREPPTGIGQAVLKYAEPRGVAVVSDIYDLWPEFFHQILPRPIPAPPAKRRDAR
jgi:hypothetical protein